MKKNNYFYGKTVGWFQASSTVEASLLMPVILTVLFVLIYLSFFLYMRAGSVRIGYLAALRASQMEQESKKVREILAKKEFENLKEENYFGSGMCQGEICVKGDFVTVCVKTTQSLPNQIFVGGKMYENAFEDESIFTAKTNHPADFIRTCRKIQKGVEKWKE